MLILNRISLAARDWKVWVVFLSLQLPSLRALAKYVPDSLWFLIPRCLIGTWLLYADLLHDGLISRTGKRFAARSWFVIALLISLFVVQWIVYPQADALKYQGRGTPQDDALVVGGEYLAHGWNPYEALTHRNEYVSAGPGWIILALPFTLTGTIGFFNPFWIALTVLVLWRVRKEFHTPVLFLIFLMSSLAFWEMTVSGSDMISIGCALLVCTILIHRVWDSLFPHTVGEIQRGSEGEGRQQLWKAAALILLSFVATSRVVFAYTIPLLAGFLSKRGWKQSIAFLLAAGGLTAALHGIFYFWNPPAYFPLHRFADVNFLPGIVMSLVTAVISILVLILAVQRAEDTLASWILNLWLALAVTMALSALSDLIARSFALSQWEGANYLGVVMPLFVAYLVIVERISPSQPESNDLSS